MNKLLEQHFFSLKNSEANYKLFIRNETSQTLFVKNHLIIIKEFKEDGLVIECPLNICQKGHTLTLFFLHGDAELKNKIPHSGHFQEALFHAIAKVVDVEYAAELSLDQKEVVLLDLTFTQFSSEEWNILLDPLAKNQDQINDLFSLQHLVRDDE
jgi:hypothetical protein